MNQEMARTSLLVFLLCIGIYQVSVGIRQIHHPREKDFWGWIHIGAGTILLLLPILLAFWLKIFQGL